MDDSEKIALVKAMTDETNDNTISAFLTLAEQAVLNVLYPYGWSESEEPELPDRYDGTVVKAAAYYLNKRGWDFQTGHNENGINRSYESGDLPPSILREIVPVCGVTT